MHRTSSSWPSSTRKHAPHSMSHRLRRENDSVNIAKDYILKGKKGTVNRSHHEHELEEKELKPILLTELSYLRNRSQLIDHGTVDRRCLVCGRSMCAQIRNSMCSTLWLFDHPTQRQCTFHQSRQRWPRHDGRPTLVAMWFHLAMSCPTQRLSDPIREEKFIRFLFKSWLHVFCHRRKIQFNFQILIQKGYG